MITAVPWPGGVIAVTVSGLPSASLSLATTSIADAVSSSTATASSTAIGGWLVRRTVIATLAVAVAPLGSLTV